MCHTQNLLESQTTNRRFIRINSKVFLYYICSWCSDLMVCVYNCYVFLYLLDVDKSLYYSLYSWHLNVMVKMDAGKSLPCHTVTLLENPCVFATELFEIKCTNNVQHKIFSVHCERLIQIPMICFCKNVSVTGIILGAVTQ